MITIEKDLAKKQLYIVREFKAPVEKVWRAWTEAELLDKWWGPRPWNAVTKTMNFTEGGTWLYAMVGPDGERTSCRVDFKNIKPGESFSASSAFSDEDGNVLDSFPVMHWVNVFKPTATGCVAEMTISFNKESDLKTIIEMGFEGGFTIGLNQLEELLS
ncbi:ATPase [Mucilaginibacter sp. PPCGB 2223]|uniref:SRPBCC family protein n=1 Tax=Mucilaginibacter sp. PPCGB 2223 TaxID=1886027 RepID=UPI000826AB43|nr:SRPBCC domain-containing protein [Mucilaginibacter sp. PPCGB 2223]OCX51708.1 ATPase [Mucilaginibacter sp. PPCGB 2223]